MIAYTFFLTYTDKCNRNATRTKYVCVIADNKKQANDKMSKKFPALISAELKRTVNTVLI